MWCSKYAGHLTARSMQRSWLMATTFDTNLHDHAGIRWLIPFLAVIAIVAGMAFLMMLYPHVVS